MDRAAIAVRNRAGLHETDGDTGCCDQARIGELQIAPGQNRFVPGAFDCSAFIIGDRTIVIKKDAVVAAFDLAGIVDSGAHLMDDDAGGVRAEDVPVGKVVYFAAAMREVNGITLRGDRAAVINGRADLNIDGAADANLRQNTGIVEA